MNKVLIFAGGVGARMKINGETPKQFLEISGKPIIIHTLEKFQKNKNVDDIVVVCVLEWIEYLKDLLKKYNISKVSKVISGGQTGFESRLLGLSYLYENKSSDEDIVLLHDGVRPFILNELIDNNIEVAKKYGNAITVSKATETIIYNELSKDDVFLNRDYCIFARAPQTFKLVDIYKYYKQAVEDNVTHLIDSATICNYYGQTIHYVEGPQENIKITTPIDYFCACGILQSEDEELKKYR